MKNSLNSKSDIVVGSRYVKGISVLHWPLSRLLLSIFANYYVKVITGMKVSDSTGGFNGYSRKALKSILKNNISFQGYAFQIQMKFIGNRLGLKNPFPTKTGFIPKKLQDILINSLIECVCPVATT